MPEITAQVEVWSCENGHNWNIDQDPAYPKVSPYDEGYTLAKMTDWGMPVAFGAPGVGQVVIQPGECPLCFVEGAFPVPKLALGTDPQNNASYMSVLDPADVPSMTKTIVTGFDPEAGEPITEERELSTLEREALTDRLNRDVERLGLMAFDPDQVG